MPSARALRFLSKENIINTEEAQLVETKEEIDFIEDFSIQEEINNFALESLISQAKSLEQLAETIDNLPQEAEVITTDPIVSIAVETLMATFATEDDIEDVEVKEKDNRGLSQKAKDMAKRAWEAIKIVVKSIIEAGKQLFSWVYDFVISVEKQLKSAVEKLGKVSEGKQEIEYNERLKPFTVEGDLSLETALRCVSTYANNLHGFSDGVHEAVKVTVKNGSLNLNNRVADGNGAGSFMDPFAYFADVTNTWKWVSSGPLGVKATILDGEGGLYLSATATKAFESLQASGGFDTEPPSDIAIQKTGVTTWSKADVLGLVKANIKLHDGLKLSSKSLQNTNKELNKLLAVSVTSPGASVGGNSLMTMVTRLRSITKAANNYGIAPATKSLRAAVSLAGAYCKAAGAEEPAAA